MEIAMVAIRPALSKLGDLLVGEFTLEKRVRKGIESLVRELTLMYAALREVAKVPPDQLDEGVKIWAGNVKELSYQMEDIVDAFMVRVESSTEHVNPKNKVKKLLKKTVRLFKKGRDLHHLSAALDEAASQAKQLAKVRKRYEQNTPNLSACASIDPRMVALYTDVKELVGIEEPQDELIKMMIEGDDWSKHPLKTVSIVGFGGLGKTTLAQATYEKIKVQFDCGAFVSVSQNPDMKKVFKNILYELDNDKYQRVLTEAWEENHLINELIKFLTNKRYIIVIDDIWDKNVWKLIKCAFSKESPGSRLITTSRIHSVSEACSSSLEDIYEMKPLLVDVSRRLFHKRVFSHEEGCPHELIEVSNGILQKCGGIPLAIITIASLLASNHQIKTKDQWYTLLNSIGRGLTEDRSVEEMKKILLFSYYDLPSHLKPCLLYLSIYPEDQKITRDRLVWKWIAEGFIYSEKQETNLYELGDSYFNELVNRSMIQPIGIDGYEKVEACRVHDMVLDLIRSLASEENFVTILDDTESKMPTSQSNVRRLSIQSGKIDVATSSMTQLRSLTVLFTDNSVDQVQNISSFQVLRVLDLGGCKISDIGYVRNLLHLRYISVMGTGIKELPVEIGKLQFLQTLDIRGTQIKELPSSVVWLTRLKCLYVDYRDVKFPSGIGNLTSLEVLSFIDLSDGLNLPIIKGLGNLTKLRVLQFTWGSDLDESLCKALVESLNNMHKLEILVSLADSEHADLMREGWAPSQQLRVFRMILVRFLALPAWINPSSLPLLSYLDLTVNKVRPEEIQLLGMMPALRYIFLEDAAMSSTERVAERLVFPANAFPCVTDCGFYTFTVVPCVFPRGAAPRLKHLGFSSPATWIVRGDFDLGMSHLPSLEDVTVHLYREEGMDREAKEAEAALRAAAEAHPNRPAIELSTRKFR